MNSIKERSEQQILAAGGRICDWLPHLEERKLRSLEEIDGRMLTLHAMLQIAFGAPPEVIADWLEENELSAHLAPSERAILERGSVTEQEKKNLYWYLEALWTMAWVLGMIEGLPFDEPVGSQLASLLPNLQEWEEPDATRARMRLRSYDEVYAMLDLYFRLHWFTRDCHLTGQDSGKISLDIIMERRKALEWALDPERRSWDEVPDGT